MLQGKYPLIVSTILGLTAGLVAYSAAMAKTRAQDETWKPVRVLCAARNVDEGSALTDDLFTVCDAPEKLVTSSFIRVGDDVADESDLPLGEKLIVPLQKGDPILYSDFESRKEFPAADAVSPHYRAMSLRVTEDTAVDQLIRPNDHVDVVGAFRTEDGKELISTTVLQNVTVLATGRTTGTSPAARGDDRRYTDVALQVEPEDAELLMLASQAGVLALTLRNPEDDDAYHAPDGQVTKFASLVDGERRSYLDTPPPVKPHAMKETTVQMFNPGGTEERVPVSP